ncbi:MAG: sulfotransferase, partial [Acidimicrobiia bacterium]
ANSADPGRFTAVGTLCVLLGHTKSGGSLLGAMLDAHPDVVFGDEVDVMDLVEAGFTADEVIGVLARSSRREAMKGRVTARRLDGGYSLAIAGSDQGRVGRPHVVGVSRAGPTTRILGESPASIALLDERMAPRRVMFVQMVRAPADSVAAMVLRSGRDPVDAAHDHRSQCERLEMLRALLKPRLTTVYYEDLVARTVPTLESVASFLGVQADPDYLRACAALVNADRPGESDRVDWPEAARTVMAETTADFSFLDRYRSP